MIQNCLKLSPRINVLIRNQSKNKKRFQETKKKDKNKNEQRTN